MTKKTKRDVYAEVTDRIVAALEGGTKPWELPWVRSSAGVSNPISGTVYSGVNPWLLGLTMLEQGYTDPRFVTFNQAKKAGGTIRKGEKGSLIVYFRMLEVTDRKSGDMKKIPMLRMYSVFNLSQTQHINDDGAIVDGLPKYQLTVPEERPEVDVETGYAMAIALVEGIKADGLRWFHKGSRAYYQPSADAIAVPVASDFKSIAGYWATCMHEATHATGHSSRLDRQFGGRFGSDAYAFEELIAELGSAFACAHAGIESSLDNHASYLESWLRVLKKDKHAIFTAQREAKKACEWLIAHADQDFAAVAMAA